MNPKEKIRKEALFRRNSLSEKERKEKSQIIIRYLINSNYFQKAKKILFYASFRSEVETFEGIKKALSMGKEVYLPRTHIKSHSLSLHRINNLEELSPGAYGILEPPADNPQIKPEELDLIICPGVAFDLKGGRIGYGGGYYDRLLQKAINVTRIALAFECQLFDSLPLDKHDIRVHAIITENGLRKFT